MEGVKLLCYGIWPSPLVNVGFRVEGLGGVAAPSPTALFSLVTSPTFKVLNTIFMLVTPKWIFPSLNALFQTCGSNTSLLGISTWPGISKRHFKINMSKTEFLIPCPDNKRIHPFLPPASSLNKCHHHLLICSSQKPVSSLTQFDLLSTSNRWASCYLTSNNIYLIHPLLSTSIDTILIQDTIISCLSYLMAPLSSLLPLLSPGCPFSTLKPEWTFKSISHIMSSSAYILQCLPWLEENLIRKSILLTMAPGPVWSGSFLCVWAHHPSLSASLVMSQPPWPPSCSSNTPSLPPPQNLWSCSSLCLEWDSPRCSLHWLLLHIQIVICHHFRGLLDHTTVVAPRVGVRVRVR